MTPTPAILHVRCEATPPDTGPRVAAPPPAGGCSSVGCRMVAHNHNEGPAGNGSVNRPNA